MPWGLYNAPLEERIALMTELHGRALGANDLPQALRALAALALYRIDAGDFAGFGRDVDEMLAISGELGHPWHRWRALLLASMRALMIGDFADSDRHVTEVAQLAALVDDTAFPLAFATHDVLRKRLQRKDDEARAAMAGLEERMRDLVEPTIHIALYRAACAARRGDADEVEKALAAIGDRTSFIFGDAYSTALFAEACAVAGTDEQRRALRAMLASDRVEVGSDPVAYVYEGTVVRLRGLLDAALGDLRAAEEELREAHALAVARRHSPWVAQIAYELARLLARAGREDDARKWATESLELARDLGMTGLEKSAARMAGARPPAPVDADRLPVRLERVGAEWRVGRGAASATVKHSRGMELLARLVERPDEEIHVLLLVSDEGTSLPDSNAGDLLDERAVADYRRRIAEIDEELAEAERCSDPGRIAKLRQEREALFAEVSRALGLGGRRRSAGSASERARVNVQRRLKDAITRIGEVNAELGRFFERSVRTGTFCAFRP